MRFSPVSSATHWESALTQLSHSCFTRAERSQRWTQRSRSDAQHAPSGLTRNGSDYAARLPLIGFGFGFYTARDPLVAPAPPGPIRRARTE